jgi:PAS domain S-box-containing protein
MIGMLAFLLCIVALSLFATIQVASSRIEHEVSGGKNVFSKVSHIRPPIFLATIAPSSKDKFMAVVAVVFMLLTFGTIVPYATVDTAQFAAFPAVTDALLCITYFVIGFIIFGQYLRLKSAALLALACGFLFQSLMAVCHAAVLLDFGAFNANTQIVPWLYILWRGVTPLFLITYACLHDHERFQVHRPNMTGTFAVLFITLLSVGGSALMVFMNHALPTLITGVNYSPLFGYLIGPSILTLNIFCLLVLWFRGNNLLDLWLMVAICASCLDVMVSTVFGVQRYDIGYYAGRGFGLFSACVILGALLNELSRLYAQLFDMMQQQQQRSDAQYQAIVDTAVDAIIVIDAKGGVQSFNRSAETIFGYMPEEVIGQNVAMLMAEPYRSNHDQYLTNYLTTGQKSIIGIGREVVGKHKNGENIMIDLAVAEWWNGDERMFTGVLRDISDKKRIEKQLIQSQKMEAIGQLSGGMAHDFNNILGVVVGNLDLLIEYFPDGPPEELTDAIEASNAGADLVRRLLAFARRQPLIPKTIQLDDIVKSLLPLVGRMIGDKIIIETHYDEKVAPVVADPAQFENALLNLIINSRDAMPEGGKLIVECRNQTIDQHSATEYDIPEGAYTTLVVSDTGTGIPTEVLSHVFEPFFTTKPPGSGSGLGLSMVFGYAKQSGGVVRIYSEIGKGTSVRLYLPSSINKAEEEPQDLELDDSKLHGNERILVVEDSPSALAVAHRILLSLGYSVRLAKNAIDAISLIDAGEQFDMLFTDVVMPDSMNGVELAKLMKQRFPLMKILFSSGFSVTSQGDIDDLGAIYITKPYNKLQLARTIRGMFLNKG